MLFPLSKSGGFTAKVNRLLECDMSRTMYQFTLKPILDPSSHFNFVVHGAFTLLQQGFIHVTFGGRYDHDILTIAFVLSAVGNCTWNVPVEVLSLPKSSTIMAGLSAPSYL